VLVLIIEVVERPEKYKCSILINPNDNPGLVATILLLLQNKPALAIVTFCQQTFKKQQIILMRLFAIDSATS